MLKAQVDIFSVVLIVLIAISLTSAALIWGIPLIQKHQDSALVGRVHNAFTRELPSRIENVANLGGEVQFSVDVEGVWGLDVENDNLNFTFMSKVSDKIDTGEWVGENCNFLGQTGVFGIDKPYIICAKALKLGSEYQITYPDYWLAIRYNFWNYLKLEITVLREYMAITWYWLRGWI